MNDNLPLQNFWRKRGRRSQVEWVSQIQEVRAIGIRALAKPESLTMGEIQDIAMGFLMAAGTLERMSSLPD